METAFEQWCILELMGHRRLAGKVTDATIGGGSFLRIDIPGRNGTVSTQYYSPGSVYCITPTTEEIARAVAEQSEPAPISRWELPKALQQPEIGCVCGVCGAIEVGHPPAGWQLSNFQDAGGRQYWMCPQCVFETMKRR